MDTADILAIERLLSDFAWFADLGDGDGLAALFLPDAVLTVGAMDLVGRQQISADCRRRAADGGRKTRHVWSNLRITHSGENEVSTTAVQMTFEQTDPAKPAQLRVNDIFDRLRKDAGEWRFARRVIRREMSLAVAAAAASTPASG